MFSQIEKKLPSITCILFIDNLGVLILDCSISIVKQLLGKAGKISLEWGGNNLVIYNMSKTKAILFFKTGYQKLIKQILDTQLNIGIKTVSFNKDTI